MAGKDPTDAAHTLFGSPSGPEAARAVAEWPERVGLPGGKRMVNVVEPEDIDRVRGAWVWMDSYEDDLVVESLLAGAERVILPLAAKTLLEEEEAFEVEDFLFADGDGLVDVTGTQVYLRDGDGWQHIPSDEEE